MESAPLQQLAAKIRDEIERLGGSKTLSEAIANANQSLPKRVQTVDRRKLKRISDAADLSPSDHSMSATLTLYELAALDNYFKPSGGLAAIFEVRDIVSLLAECREVTFYLGAKPIEDTDFISRWDMQAMEELMQMLARTADGTQIDAQDAFLRDHCEPRLSPDGYESLFNTEPWFQKLTARNSDADVCLGSPRATNASEIALSRLLGVRPFAPDDVQAQQQLPFQFVWTDEEYQKFPSTFAIRESSLSPNTPRRETRSRSGRSFKISALKVGEDLYEVERVENEWDTYGVIALAREETGGVLGVCAGLSGTGTLAAARMLKSIRRDLLPEDGAVLWAAVKARVTRDQQHPGQDGRRLVSQEFLEQPQTWRPSL